MSENLIHDFERQLDANISRLLESYRALLSNANVKICS